MAISITSGPLAAYGHFPAGAHHLVTLSSTSAVNIILEVYEYDWAASTYSKVSTMKRPPDIGSSSEFTFDLAAIPRDRVTAHEPTYSGWFGTGTSGNWDRVEESYKWYQFRAIEERETTGGLLYTSGDADDQYLQGTTSVFEDPETAFAFHWASHADEANKFAALGNAVANYSSYIIDGGTDGGFLTNRNSFTIHDNAFAMLGNMPLSLDILVASGMVLTMEASTYLGDTLVTSGLTADMEALPSVDASQDGTRLRVDISPDFNQALGGSNIGNVLTALQNGTADRYKVQFYEGYGTDGEEAKLATPFTVIYDPRCSRQGVSLYYANEFGGYDFMDFYARGDDMLDIERVDAVKVTRSDAHDNAAFNTWNNAGNFAMRQRNNLQSHVVSRTAIELESDWIGETAARDIWRELAISPDVWIRHWGYNYAVPVQVRGDSLKWVDRKGKQPGTQFAFVVDYSRPHKSQRP